jgi:hypothetical protein
MALEVAGLSFVWDPVARGVTARHHRRVARPWIVLPHGPVERLDEALRAVEGSLPRSPVPRRMSIARLAGGRLVFHNAVPLAEPAMADLEAWGEPSFLVVPNRFHRLDLAAWIARYPRCAVVCPPEARAAVAALVPVTGDLSALPRDPALAVEPLGGMRSGEAAIAIRSRGGAVTSLLFGDAVMNLPHLPGVRGLLLRAIGSTGGPRVTPLARLVAVSDRRALAASLERLARTPGLARLVPSHGAIVETDAARVLADVARRLRG